LLEIGFELHCAWAFIKAIAVKSVSINFFIVLRFKIFLIIVLNYLTVQKYIVLFRLQFILS